MSRIFVKIRVRIAEECERASPFGGTVEVAESYFGAKRARGAAGKTIVFGIFKRNGAVYTEMVPDCKAPDFATNYSRSRRARHSYSPDGWRG